MTPRCSPWIPRFFSKIFSVGDDSQALLEAHRELISEETVHYLADWCMEFEKQQVKFCFLQKFIEEIKIFLGIY